MPFYEGLITGLLFVVVIATPVFFTLLYSTLSYGWKAGLAVVGGIFTGDVLAVFLLYGLGVTEILTDPSFLYYTGWAGAIVILILGFYFAFKRNIDLQQQPELPKGHYFNFFYRGFLVNFISPFLFIAWIGFVTVGSGRFPEGNGPILFLSGILVGILIQDTAKVFLAHRIKTLLRPIWVRRLYQTVGVVLVVIGVVIMFKIVQNPDISSWEMLHTGLKN